MDMDNTRVEEGATKIVAQVVTTTALLNDQLSQILLTKFNLPLDPLAHNRTWLEISFFGAYTLLQRAQFAYSAEELIALKEEVASQLPKMIAMLVFNEDDDKKGGGIKEYISSEYSSSITLYEKHVGDTSVVLRNLIRDVFNTSENSKIKFIDNDWKTKLKLKFAFAMGDSEFHSKHKDEQYLSADALLEFTKLAAEEFRMLDQSELV